MLQLLDERMKRTCGALFFPKNSTGALVHLLEEYFDQWMTNAAIYFRWCFPESALHGKTVLSSGMAPAEMAPTLGEIIQGW